MCGSCNRRILKDLFESHSSGCGSGPSSQDANVEILLGGEVLESPIAIQSNLGEDVVTDSQPIEEIKLSTLPIFTLDDRKDQLEKFEVVLLKKAQVKEFEEMFLKKEFTSVKDPLYRAWLLLKFAAAGTETEAIDRLLSSKIAKNVPKRKTKRKDAQPSGPARHDPSSPASVSILTEQKENKKNVSAPKRKSTTAQPKKIPAKKPDPSNKENNNDLIL